MCNSATAPVAVHAVITACTLSCWPCFTVWPHTAVWPQHGLHGCCWCVQVRRSVPKITLPMVLELIEAQEWGPSTPKIPYTAAKDRLAHITAAKAVALALTPGLDPIQVRYCQGWPGFMPKSVALHASHALPDFFREWLGLCRLCGPVCTTRVWFSLQPDGPLEGAGWLECHVSAHGSNMRCL